jgi:hypothetical protein
MKKIRTAIGRLLLALPFIALAGYAVHKNQLQSLAIALLIASATIGSLALGAYLIATEEK